MDFKVSSGISIDIDTEQAAEPHLEQPGCHFLGARIHRGIPIGTSRLMKCNKRVFICVSGTKISPDVFTQNLPGGPENFGACCPIIFVPVTHVYFPCEA